MVKEKEVRLLDPAVSVSGSEEGPGEDGEGLFKKGMVDEEVSVKVEGIVEEFKDSELFLVPSILCQRCDHFALPPEIGCKHEEAEVLRRESGDRFLVADCPTAISWKNTAP